MTTRIEALTALTLKGEMYAEPTKTEFDREDLFLTESERDVKQLCEYIRNQEPVLTEYSAMTGFFNFDGSVIGDAFHRSGHRATAKLMDLFYLIPLDNLSTMEWQHATADYRKVLAKGILGIIDEIEVSEKKHTDEKQLGFLSGIKKVAYAMIDWTAKCADRAVAFAESVENPHNKANLLRLSETIRRVPAHAPQSFYEAVLTIYVCFSADPDSIGTLDRYLAPFYDAEIRAGSLTRDEAAEYLQELFLMLQAETRVTSNYFTRGAESHFCIGGYLPDGTDGFSETSRLIVDAMTELPTYIPQLTLRWTSKTPREVLRYVMDKERNDPHKRIAFTNDEKRLKCFTEICGFSFEDAVNYTMVGCNEPAFCGAITGSNSKGNIVHSIACLFRYRPELIRNATTFDEFYAVFEKELYADLDRIYDYDNKYNLERAKDINYISSLFFNGCVESATSLTQGGGRIAIASPMLIGLTNVIDSLITVKQFVYDEKIISMDELINALSANWSGYGDLRTVITKKGVFFGNDDDRSNEVARRLYDSFYRYLNGKKNVFGYQFLIGDLLGYNEHHKMFGDATPATPDGRYDGEPLKFCIGQSDGRDKNGLTAILNAVSGLDPNAIACGSTVTNITLERQLVEDDASFEKLVSIFETYFRNGGVHFQLTYVSAEELKAAKIKPADYQNLRVRVTGFSDYFVNLKESLQDDIIRRTEIAK